MSYQAVARFKVPAVVVTLIAALCLCVPPVSAATGTVPVSSWRVVSTPALVGHWYAVDYIGGKWIALGRTARIAVSRNGTTWTEHSVPLGSWHSISYGNGLFVSLSSANAGPHEMVSTNGVNWTLATGPAGAWTGVTFGGGRFVAVSSIGQLDTSTDGVHWTQTWVHSKFHFTSVAYGNGRFIAVDNAQGDVVISLNGIGWSFYPISSPGEKWGAVTYGNGNFVTFNQSSGVIATTVLGYVWTTHAYPPSQRITAAAFGCNRFVAAGRSTASRHDFFTSRLGASWSATQVPLDTASDWTSLAYGDFRFVAVNDAGNIASLHVVANCAATPPMPPQQVSGNVRSGEVWTYQHPPMNPGGAPVDGYLVTVSDGTSTKQCFAPVYYQPNCIIKGLRNHQIYTVSTQAHNRFGYSVPTDLESVIPVASSSLSAVVATPVVAPSSPVVVQLTGVVASAQGIYPASSVTVHFGEQLLYCQPNPFGECVLTIPHAAPGRTSIYATYSGYGRSYQSPTSYVTIVK